MNCCTSKNKKVEEEEEDLSIAEFKLQGPEKEKPVSIQNNNKRKILNVFNESLLGAEFGINSELDSKLLNYRTRELKNPFFYKTTPLITAQPSKKFYSVRGFCEDNMEKNIQKKKFIHKKIHGDLKKEHIPARRFESEKCSIDSFSLEFEEKISNCETIRNFLAEVQDGKVKGVFSTKNASFSRADNRSPVEVRVVKHRVGGKRFFNEEINKF